MHMVTALMPDDLPAAKVLRQRPPTFDEIIKECADYYDIPLDRFMTGRDRLSSHARRCAFYLARRYTRLSCDTVAKLTGRRGHTTAVAAAMKVNGIRLTDERLRDDIDILERRIAQTVLNWRFTPCR